MKLNKVLKNYVFQTLFFIVSSGVIMMFLVTNMNFDPSVESYVISKAVPKEQHNIYILDAGHGKTLIPCKHNAVLNKQLNECFYEYEFNKSVVDKIAELLKENGIFFLYTDSLTYQRNMHLRDRIQFIKKIKSKYDNVVVLSIHGNAARDTSVRGIEIYTNIKKKDEFFTNPQTFYANTVKAIDLFYTNLSTSLNNIPFRKGKKYLFKEDHESQFNQLAILSKTPCYAFLFELGFFTNLKDQELMRSNEYRNKLAKIFTQTILQIEGVK